MYKNRNAIFFTFLFMAMIIAPSIIVSIDKSIDISILYSISQEEEKEGKENKNIEEFLLSELDFFETDIYSYENQVALGYYLKNYPKPHLNLISPPPELA